MTVTPKKGGAVDPYVSQYPYKENLKLNFKKQKETIFVTYIMRYNFQAASKRLITIVIDKNFMSTNIF